MACTGCADRQREIMAAGKALRARRPEQAVQHAQAAARSLSDDAKAFARNLKARLVRR